VARIPVATLRGMELMAAGEAHGSGAARARDSNRGIGTARCSTTPLLPLPDLVPAQSCWVIIGSLNLALDLVFGSKGQSRAL
jgi:hypothetical protein